MAHTIANKTQLTARVRRIVGQLNSVERALEENEGCEAILHQVAGARGAINGLLDEIMADFVRSHVAAPKSAETRTAAAEELIAIIRRYTK